MLWIGIGIWSPHHAFSTTIVCQIWKDKIIHGSLLGDKCDHHAVVEALNPNNGMIPNGSHIHSKQTKGYWQPSYAEHGDKDPQSCCYHLTCGTGLEKTWSIMDHCWVTTTIMIPSTSGWNSKPTWTMVSTPHISKVIHNLLIHMLWMGIWSPHHAVTTTLVGPGLESQLKSLITTRCKMIPSCSGWGSHPTWNGSHFHFKHIKSYWQPSYMLWMGIWSPHHAVTTTLVGPNLESPTRWQMKPSCSGWGSHPTMEWFPHPLKAYKRGLTYFICCGWGSVAPHHAFTSTLVGPDLECQLKSLMTSGRQMISSCIVWGSKHTWNGSHIHFKYTRGYWQPSCAMDEDMEHPSCCYHHTLVGPDLESQLKSLITDRWQMIPSCIGKAVIPHGMVPTSSLNIEEIIDILHMLWMGIWSPHHTVTTTLCHRPWYWREIYPDYGASR